MFSYNDGLRNGSRTPKLFIVHRGTIHKFVGQGIEGVVAVARTKYEKNGKWSNTTFDLELAEGAKPCLLLAPLHGQVWPENDRMTAYKRFMKEFSVTISFEEFDEMLETEYARSRQRMLETEATLESLDVEASGDTELVEISTSKANRRTPHDDVRVTAADGQTWVVAHEAPRGTEIPNVAKLVDVKSLPGYRGGSTTLVFAVTTGTKVTGEYYGRDVEGCQYALGRGGNGQPAPEALPASNATSDGSEGDPSSVETLLAKFGPRN